LNLIEQNPEKHPCNEILVLQKMQSGLDTDTLMAQQAG